MRNQPALDGVRAGAVLAVLVAHSTAHGEGGILGVDVFFVLSGFLITSLLHEERARTGRVALGSFYMRRAWRLMPPLLFCLLLVALLPNVYIHPQTDGPSSPRWQTELLAGTYLSNFAGGFHVSMGYLGHTWSLAVEEQFYLLWPVTLLLLLRKGRAVPTICALIVLAIALRPTINANWLPARADGLLLGALLAVLAAQGRAPTFLRSRVVGAGAVVVMLLDAGAVSATHAREPFVFVAISIIGLAAAVLIGHVTQAPDAPLARLLASRPLVEIGKLSYTIYLLHFPIFQWVAHQRHGTAATYGLEFALTTPAVVACWLLVERPARRQKAKWSTVPSGDPVTASVRAGRRDDLSSRFG